MYDTVVMRIVGRSCLRRWGILFAGEQSNPNLKQRERDDNIRDFETRLLSQVCEDVETEPSLQSLSYIIINI